MIKNNCVNFSEQMCKQAGVYDNAASACQSPNYTNRLTGGARQMIVSRNMSLKSGEMAASEESRTKEWDIASVDNESGGHDSDTGMESMSSTEMPHGSESSKHSSHRLSCSFCIDGNHEPEQKRLEELLHDVELLKEEKSDLLRQNVTCKTDIKKLKDR